MKSHTFVKIFYRIQFLLVHISYFIFNFSKKEKDGTVIGLVEVASLLHHISSALPNSTSVNIIKNPYYNFKYDHDYSKFGLLKFIALPILLGKLAAQNQSFVYIGAAGFLSGRFDGRTGEFNFLKSVNCKVVCYFTGTDIRSFELLNEYGKDNNLDVITTYQHISHIGVNSYESEIKRKNLANAADTHADLIFNPPTDQMSYITRRTLPALYFYPDKEITFNSEKWENVEKLVVVHGPSSPIIKGTPIVRAAIKQLQEEGFDFEYLELIDMPNNEVLSTLKRAHIVLNEFYAFVPGVFGVEAMASNSVLLTSADMNREPTLFFGANSAWVVTPYWSIYNNLKAQLSKPISALKEQADEGTNWVNKYCSYSSSALFLNEKLSELID